jgi:hypothetical protein
MKYIWKKKKCILKLYGKIVLMKNCGFFEMVVIFAKHDGSYFKSGGSTFTFLAFHPCEDGNRRLARALTDMALAQYKKMKVRFYSISYKIIRRRLEAGNSHSDTCDHSLPNLILSVQKIFMVPFQFLLSILLPQPLLNWVEKIPR